MEQRRIIIGAIGGDRQAAAAKSFGEAVAQAGCILLTGSGDREDDEVKNATRMGAFSAARTGVTARFIGVLASERIDWQPSPYQLLLHTGLRHNARNLINGLTPDIVVVFGGSRGTLAEAAFACAANKELFFYGGPDGGAVERLRQNFETYFGPRSGGADTETYLERPLEAFPSAWSGCQTSGELKALLTTLLSRVEDWKGSPADLVERCIAAARARGSIEATGFPGLPGEAGAKPRFEAEDVRISAAG